MTITGLSGGPAAADRFITVVEAVLDLLVEENALARGAVVAPAPTTPGGTLNPAGSTGVPEKGYGNNMPPGMTSTAGVELPTSVKTAIALPVQRAFAKNVMDAPTAGEQGRAQQTIHSKIMGATDDSTVDLAAAPRLPSQQPLHLSSASSAKGVDEEEMEARKLEQTKRKQFEANLVTPIGSYSTDHQSFLRELHKVDILQPTHFSRILLKRCLPAGDSSLAQIPTGLCGKFPLCFAKRVTSQDFVDHFRTTRTRQLQRQNAAYAQQQKILQEKMHREAMGAVNGTMMNGVNDDDDEQLQAALAISAVSAAEESMSEQEQLKAAIVASMVEAEVNVVDNEKTATALDTKSTADDQSSDIKPTASMDSANELSQAKSLVSMNGESSAGAVEAVNDFMDDAHSKEGLSVSSTNPFANITACDNTNDNADTTSADEPIQTTSSSGGDGTKAVDDDDEDTPDLSEFKVTPVTPQGGLEEEQAAKMQKFVLDMVIGSAVCDTVLLYLA